MVGSTLLVYGQLKLDLMGLDVIHKGKGHEVRRDGEVKGRGTGRGSG